MRGQRTRPRQARYQPAARCPSLPRKRAALLRPRQGAVLAPPRLWRMRSSSRSACCTSGCCPRTTGTRAWRRWCTSARRRRRRRRRAPRHAAASPCTCSTACWCTAPQPRWRSPRSSRTVSCSASCRCCGCATLLPPSRTRSSSSPPTCWPTHSCGSSLSSRQATRCTWHPRTLARWWRRWPRCWTHRSASSRRCWPTRSPACCWS
mmetsp:Transcript_27149/g.69072  ORF Transcript_27149/g.69072 Transcript_27149/m.69072 type:complete len:206 (-) Transcript_27149:2394-3011(-)